MKINGWHIEGFGVFADFEVREIAPGLTIFEGHNGAGKSTLFAFVQTMLFGPPTSRNDPKYHPLNGGQHAGSLCLTGSDGHTYTVHRHLAKRGDLSIRRDAEPVEATVLNRLVGQCDHQMFKAVFAFGLSELQQLDAMERDDIKGRLALAGLSGAGASPQEVLKWLDDRKGALLRQRSGKAEINLARDQIEEINTRLKHARAASSQYDAVRQRESDATDERVRIERELRQLGLERARYQRLIELWPTWCRFNEAMQERDELTLNDALGRISNEADSFHASIDRYNEWQVERDVWGSKHRTAEAYVTEHLRNLGPEWNEARLVDFDRSIPRREDIRGFETRLRASEDALRRAEEETQRRREHATHAKQAREEAAALRIEAGEPETQEILDCQRASLKRLRATLTDATALEMKVRADEQHLSVLTQHHETEASKVAGSAPVWLAWAAWLAALILVVLGAWLLVDGVVVTGGVLLAAGVSLVVTGVVAQRRHSQGAHAATPSYVQRELDQLSQSLERDRSLLDELNRTIASYGEVAGVSATPSSFDVEDASSRLDQRVQHRQSALAKQTALDEAIRLEGEASEALSIAEQSRQNALDANAAEMANWREWQVAAGIPANLSPGTSIDFLGESEAAREQHQAADEAKAEVARLSEALGNLEGQLQTVLEEVGEPAPAPGHATVLAIEHLMARVNEDRQAKRIYAQLDERARTAEQSVTETLGAGEEAIVSRQLLKTGSVIEWHEMVNGATARITELEDKRIKAIEDGQTAQDERGRLEASGAIATLETELNGLQAEATGAIREWAVLSLASGLIQRTLAKFERERQPEVLQHASTLFSNVTGGEYRRVSRSLEAAGKDNGGVTISPSSGEPLTADQLSRGTMEQLYLCLRLGLATSLSEQTGALPLLMDDVLVNFDPRRARQVAEVLCQVAEQRQVLLFTCHPRIVNMLQDVNGGCAHYKMGHNGQAGAWRPTA